jgi:DNA-binding PadR family transcriptional regulator
VTWAVLALVIERPSYGYELGQRFDRRFTGVLDSSMSHVYAALDRLERDKLIAPIATKSKTGGPRQPKVQYRVTPNGAQAYRDWTSASMRVNFPQSEVLSLLAGAVGRDVQTMLEILDEYEQVCLEAITQLEVMPEEAKGDSSRALMARLIIEQRRTCSLGQLEWIDYARHQVEAFGDRNDIPLEPPEG